MRYYKIKIVNAFTDSRFCGNPAGVVLGDEELSEGEMKKIARELGYSETAFILNSNRADFKIKYFTPQEEIDLCGHATIASLYALFEEGALGLGDGIANIRLDTKVGILNTYLEIRNGGLEKIMMEQALPQFRDIDADYDKLADILNIDKKYFRMDIPLKIAYTGLWDLMVPIINREIIDGIVPDFEKMRKYSEENDIVSFHLYSIGGNKFLYTRNFAPAVGINEDPVTGTSNCALVGYLLSIGLLDFTADKILVVAEQGHALQRPGRVFVEAILEHGLIKRIMVGGKAVTFLKGELILD